MRRPRPEFRRERGEIATQRLRAEDPEPNLAPPAGACGSNEVRQLRRGKVLVHGRVEPSERARKPVRKTGPPLAALGAPFAARVEAVRRLRQARGTRNATGEVKVAGVSQKKKVLKESEIDMSRAGDVCDGLLAGESRGLPPLNCYGSVR